MTQDNDRGMYFAVSFIVVGVSILGMAVAGAFFGMPGVFGAGGAGFILCGCFGLWAETKGRKPE